MYVGLKNIQQLFSDMPNLLTVSDYTHCLTGWGKLYNCPTPYISHLLYVCEYDNSLQQFPFDADMHLLCIVKEDCNLETLASEFPSNVSVLLVQCADSESVFSKLQAYFNTQCGVGMLGQTLLEFLSYGADLQEGIHYAFRSIGNPIFIFDGNFNLIAANWEEVERLNMKDDLVINKKFSDREYQMANSRQHIHDRVMKSEVPIRAYNEELGYEQLLCAINTKKNLGHIVVSAVNKPFEQIDIEFLTIFRKYVDQQMSKDSFIRNAKGFNYEYFLRDLLDGKIATNQAFAARTKYVDMEFSGNMYCMVVETARSSSAININHVRNVIENRFPYAKTLIYNGQIVAIISLQKNQLMPQEYLDIAQRICVENGIFSGLSNCFQDIMTFSEYYFQALRSIELGICQCNEPRLFLYKDYYLDHIKNIFTQKESASTFCHPKMKFLLDYDKAHRSELAYTLYMYLSHERNLAAASEAMGMHRTSLVYRFKKINTLIGDDFDDYKERMYLILSYEMNCL